MRRPAGLPISDTGVDADPFEIVSHRLTKETLRPLENDYVLQVTEELRECSIWDEAKFASSRITRTGTEVHSTSKLVPGRSRHAS